MYDQYGTDFVVDPASSLYHLPLQHPLEALGIIRSHLVYLKLVLALKHGRLLRGGELKLRMINEGHICMHFICVNSARPALFVCGVRVHLFSLPEDPDIGGYDLVVW